MSSLRDKILSQKLKTKTITVPEWDCDVTVQEMSINRRVAFVELIDENAAAIRKHKTDPVKYPEVKVLDEVMLGVIFSIVDENSNLVFTVDDIPALEEKSYHTLQSIYLEALRMSRLANLGEEVETEKKD